MPSPATTESAARWTRTSPVAVVFFITRFLRYMVTDGLPAVAPLLALVAAIDNKAWLYTGVGLLLVLASVLAVLSYLRFQFRFEGSRIGVRRGIWHREQLSVDFDRIQNVNLREPFYMRPFGLVLVGIETAGSAQKEVTLGGIPRAAAESMREAMLSRRAGPPRPDETAVEDSVDSQGSVLVERSDGEIARYGLTSNFMLWAAIALGVIFGSFDLGERLVAYLIDSLDLGELVASGRLGLAILIGFLVILSGLLVLPLISVAGALIRYRGYRLTRNGDTYRRTSGVVTRHEESLPQHKIQALEWHQNAVARGLDRINLKLRVTSAGSAAESGQISALTAQPFVVPVLTAEEADALVDEFLPGCQAQAARFSPIAVAPYAARIWLFFWPPALTASLLPGILVSPWFGLVGVAILLPSWLILMRVGARLGYAVDGEFGFVRTGFIGHRITIFPLYKVQRVDVRQSPGQRRKGRAHLTVQLASHELTVPYLPLEDAERFRDLALYHAESSDRPWY